LSAKRVQQEAQQARVKWLRLTAPRRLETMAESFGLQPPTIDQILKYEVEKGQTRRASR
jgi:Mg2+ and Co2+ transporter CorA